MADTSESTGATSIANHRRYDSFGRRVWETNDAVDLVFGYTGKLFDETTRLQNNLNRWYDSSTGRWISQDPIGFAAGDANLYRYVGNSPTNRTDPSGRDWLDEVAGFGASIGDSMSFGISWVIRDKMIGMNGVDYNGGGYYWGGWGGWGGVAVDVGTCGLTAIPKAGGKAVIKTAAKEGGEALAREIAERAAREAAEAAAKAAAESAAKNQAKSGSKGLLDWWKRGSEIDDYWRSLSLMDKIMYEIGEKTLASAKYAEYANLDRVSRGRKIIEDSGWFRAVCPEGTGWRLGAGTTLGTGPTPSVRWLVPHAIVITVRSIFVSNWNNSKPVENPAQ
jgi:RHS repeat-associated protein